MFTLVGDYFLAWLFCHWPVCICVSYALRSSSRKMNIHVTKVCTAIIWDIAMIIEFHFIDLNSARIHRWVWVCGFLMGYQLISRLAKGWLCLRPDWGSIYFWIVFILLKNILILFTDDFVLFWRFCLVSCLGLGVFRLHLGTF